ncbi:MAG: tetratricopeptide repeat protein [Xanthobacteraceae bacterium]
MWLAGCETTSKVSNPFRSLASAIGPQGDATAADPTPTGSTAAESTLEGRAPTDSPPTTPELLGADPNDELNVAKKYFRQGSYGLAERHFRRTVELHPRDAEAWIGLAAAYDRLRRFDLADRAYAQATRILGPTSELLNNQGFSFMLRGDYRRARATLLAARAKDPANPYIQNNLRMLRESARKAKAVN